MYSLELWDASRLPSRCGALRPPDLLPVVVVPLQDLGHDSGPVVETAPGRRIDRAAEADAAVPARRVQVAAEGRITVGLLEAAITEESVVAKSLLAAFSEAASPRPGREAVS